MKSYVLVYASIDVVFMVGLVVLYCSFRHTAIVIYSEWVREWVCDYYIGYTVVDVVCVVVGAVAGVTIMILMVSGVFHRQLF